MASSQAVRGRRHTATARKEGDAIDAACRTVSEGWNKMGTHCDIAGNEEGDAPANIAGIEKGRRRRAKHPVGRGIAGDKKVDGAERC